MKEKYFNVNELYVGCLGKIQYLEKENNYDWIRKEASPYVIFKKRISESLDDCHECKNVFSGEKYYLFNEVCKRKSTFDIVCGNYIIAMYFPLKSMLGNGAPKKEKLSMVELKSIECHFNLTKALYKNSDDKYLTFLNDCLNVIDMLEEGKVKEYYMRKIFSLITEYTSIIFESYDYSEYDRVIEKINRIRQELDRENEITVKKVKKL